MSVYNILERKVSTTLVSVTLDENFIQEAEALAAGMSSGNVLIVTSNYRVNTVSSDIERRFSRLLQSCGGSFMWEELCTEDHFVGQTFVFVGDCHANLPPGWSQKRGLEANFGGAIAETRGLNETAMRKTLELYFSPSEFFDAGVSADFNHQERAYEYDPSKTIFLDGLSRLNATTAGGTTIHINGSSGFVPSENLPEGGGFPENVEVYLGGVRCATNYSDIGYFDHQHLCEWDNVDCENIGLKVSEPH